MMRDPENPFGGGFGSAPQIDETPEEEDEE